MKKNIYYILFLSMICFYSFECRKKDQKNEVLSIFEKKIKIDTINNAYFKHLTSCYKIFDKPYEKGNLIGYFIHTNSGNQSVGTDIDYSYKNTILKIGTWQVKEDSFKLGNTDTIIIFSNPFNKLHCFQNETKDINDEMFSAGFTDGYSYKWTLTNKLIQMPIKENNDIYLIKYDTLNGGIITKMKL